ncbi:Aldo/keto reductase family proteins [Ceraceosorus bombacis]|uniref:Aldo/keto reductase family proteins n=1 Tax=Ceraceosorus bombacis TaxID=401625 RepID=A0A0N7L9W3_9BASI|nr:Aldo/keto reductase family proteins [Ceraceosorus bombacis]
MHASLVARRAASSKTWTLANGAKIPQIGFGVYNLNKEQANASVAHALKTGYRHLDAAWVYKNEDAVGDAIRKSGVHRDELWLTSKLWNSFHGDNVEVGLDTSLKDLGVDYLDLYLVHWPVAFSNPNASQINSLKGQAGHPVEEAKLSENIAVTWTKLEEQVKKGKIRNIGLSNFNIRRTEEMLAADPEIKPVVNQVEVNWGVANDELLHYSEANQIFLQAHSPLGGNYNVERYLQNEVVQDIAQRNNMTPAQVYISWCLARGIIPIVKSSNPQRIEENFAALDKKLAWDDVKHLTRESQRNGIERSVEPSAYWGIGDVFEDGADQERLMSLKDTTFQVPTPHESKSQGEHFLEPRNDPNAPEIGPGGTQVRSFHSLASSSSTSRTAHPTAVQVALDGGKRAFSASARPRALAMGSVAEAAPPSAAETPEVNNSSLLASTSKAALRTPGIKWTDGEDGVARETRKINLYTVRRASAIASSNLPVAHASSSVSQRAFTSSARREAFIAPTAGAAGQPLSPIEWSKREGRVYPERKRFLFDQYKSFLDTAPLIVLLAHRNIDVPTFNQIRKEIKAAGVPAAVPGLEASGSSEGAKLTVSRTALLRPLVRAHSSNAIQSLEEHLKGPTAMLTVPRLDPNYLSRVLRVLEKHSGSKVIAQERARLGGKLKPGEAEAIQRTIEKTPVLVPLVAVAEGKTLLDVPALGAVGKLPDLATLRAQIVGLLSAPASRLAGVLSQASGADLALTLEARKRDLQKADEPSQ